MSKRRQQKSVGGKVRPTTQKILESLASILLQRLEDAKVLDLFAGTGRVGLRLYDEGAESVVFVEGNRKVAQDIKSKLRGHENKSQLSVVVGPIPKVLAKIRGKFDLVVCDPPYDWEHPKTLLPGTKGLVEPGSLLVVEHHHKTPYESIEGWSLHRQEKFGETRLSFFIRVSEPVSTCS